MMLAYNISIQKLPPCIYNVNPLCTFWNMDFEKQLSWLLKTFIQKGSYPKQLSLHFIESDIGIDANSPTNCDTISRLPPYHNTIPENYHNMWTYWCVQFQYFHKVNNYILKQTHNPRYKYYHQSKEFGCIHPVLGFILLSTNKIIIIIYSVFYVHVYQGTAQSISQTVTISLTEQVIQISKIYIISWICS